MGVECLGGYKNLTEDKLQQMKYRECSFSSACLLYESVAQLYSVVSQTLAQPFETLHRTLHHFHLLAHRSELYKILTLDALLSNYASNTTFLCPVCSTRMHNSDRSRTFLHFVFIIVIILLLLNDTGQCDVIMITLYHLSFIIIGQLLVIKTSADIATSVGQHFGLVCCKLKQITY